MSDFDDALADGMQSAFEYAGEQVELRGVRITCIGSQIEVGLGVETHYAADSKRCAVSVLRTDLFTLLAGDKPQALIGELLTRYPDTTEEQELRIADVVEVTTSVLDLTLEAKTQTA